MSRPRLSKCRRLPALVAFLLLVLFLVPLANAQNSQDESGKDEKAVRKMLAGEAANALRRLKRAMEKDGFYSGRVALNIWRNTAMDAGTFDQSEYEEFKRKLYQKSIRDSMRCFEEFLVEEDFYNANVCLQTWRMHSTELGTYDQAEYEALIQKIEQAKAAKASEKSKEEQ